MPRCSCEREEQQPHRFRTTRVKQNKIQASASAKERNPNYQNSLLSPTVHKPWKPKAIQKVTKGISLIKEENTENGCAIKKSIIQERYTTSWHSAGERSHVLTTNTESRAFLWSGNPRLDPRSSFATGSQRGCVLRLRLHAEGRVSPHTPRARPVWAPIYPALQGGSDALAAGGDARSPVLSPQSSGAAKGSAGSLCPQASPQVARGRLLAYKPAPKTGG